MEGISTSDIYNLIDSCLRRVYNEFEAIRLNTGFTEFFVDICGQGKDNTDIFKLDKSFRAERIGRCALIVKTLLLLLKDEDKNEGLNRLFQRLLQDVEDVKCGAFSTYSYQELRHGLKKSLPNM